MLSETYYAQNYAGIIDLGLKGEANQKQQLSDYTYACN